VTSLPKTGLRKAVSAALTAIAVILTAALIVSGLFIRVRLIEINSEAVELKAERDELHEDNRRLIIEFETVFGIGRVEEYATEVLHMRRQSQVYADEIHVGVHDKAVIIDNNGNK